MICVVGIITDGQRVILLKKNNPDWQKGLYNGVCGEVELYSTPLDTIIEKAKEDIGLDILNWKEIDNVGLEGNIELIYFLAILEEDELNKAQTLTDEKVEFFKIDNLPNNILKVLKEQIDKIYVKTKKRRSIIKQVIISIFVLIGFLLASFMLIGKIQSGSFLYYLTSNQSKSEEDISKTIEFKEGFNERIKGSY